MPQPTVRMTKGKFNGLNALANQNGVIAALAVDQRGALKQAIAAARGRDISNAEVREFKMLVSEVLTPYASAILLDPEYSLDAIRHRSRNAGVMLAYEASGYDASVKGRLPDLLPEWSVGRLVGAGANGIKILLYYDPDEDAHINTIKQAYVERIGAECRAHDVPFFLEPITYSDEIGDEKGIEFARIKPAKVTRAMEEFSKPQYGVDILKVEVPVSMCYVAGSIANKGDAIAYSREEAQQHFSTAAAAARLPLIYLSAGMTNEVFRETLELASEAGVRFAGVLCGRATWQDGVRAYASGGAAALRGWLEGPGVENIQAINAVLATHACAWWDLYGGKERIEVV